MSYNGSGVYSPPGASFPAVAGQTIQSAKYNAVVNDIATALSTAITKDGQTTVTDDLPMSGFRHKGVGNASARDQYAASGQVQDGSFTWAGTAGGTADAITLALTPPITAYAAGQTFEYVSGASPNTTAMTVAINGLAAKAIQVNGAAVAAGDHPAGKLMRIVYDGTAFQLERTGSAVQVFGAQTIAGAKTFSGAVSCGSTLGVTGAATLSSTLAVTGNSTFTGTITPSSTNGVVGTATNDDANAGSVGEYWEAELDSSISVALATGTPKTVISLSLGAGDWTVEGLGGLNFPASTSMTSYEFSLSTTANTLSTRNTVYRGAAVVPGAGNNIQAPVKSKRIKVPFGTTTTVYLVINAIFTVSTLGGYGLITARRPR